MKNFIYFSDIVYNYDISPAILNFHFVNAEFLNDKILALTMVNQVNNQQNERVNGLSLKLGMDLQSVNRFCLSCLPRHYFMQRNAQRNVIFLWQNAFVTVPRQFSSQYVIHFSVFSILVICWALCLFCFDNFYILPCEI